MRSVIVTMLLLVLVSAPLSGQLDASARQADSAASAADQKLVIRTLDLNDDLVAGSCFIVTALEGAIWRESVCDDEQVDRGRQVGGVVIEIPSDVTAVMVELDRPPGDYQPVGVPFHDRVDLSATDRASVDFVVASPEQRAPFIQTPSPEVAGCDLVELYPGYPGYRGYVTGVDGVGDHVCLEDLVAATPSFDRPAVDRANREAAQHIGLAGGPDDWTWENWMAIEAERGLPPTCYSCAIRNAPYRVEPLGTGVAWDDPRLLIGSFGTTTALGILVGSGSTGAMSIRQNFPYDHDLRVAAGLMNPGRHLNAAEVWVAYEAFVDGIAQGGWINPDWYQLLLAQGGYVPVPPTADPQDQIFVAGATMELLARTTMPSMVANATQIQFANSANAWLYSVAVGGPVPETSFAEWLRDAVANSTTP